MIRVRKPFVRTGAAALALSCCLVAAGAVAEEAVPQRVPQMFEDNAFSQLKNTMRAAAENYSSVAAAKKTIQATGQQRTAALLNSMSLTGSLSQMEESDSLNYADNVGAKPSFNGPDTQSAFQESVSARILLSLATWFQARGIQLTQQTQKSALTALQMQLASDAGKAYIDYVVYNSRLQQIHCYMDAFNDASSKYKAGDHPISSQIASLIGAEQDSIHSDYSKAQLKRDLAASDLRKFVNPEQLQVLNSLAPAFGTCDMRYLSVPSVGFNEPDADGIFPLPSDPDAAFGLAQKSPAVIQAGLAETAAKNQWYLTLAGSGPFVAFTFTQLNTNSQIYDQPVNTNLKSLSGEQFVVSTGFSFGGGEVNSLNASGLLEQASQLSRQATESQIRGDLEKDYSTLGYAQEEMGTNARIMAESAPQVEQFPDDPNSDGKEFLDSFKNYYKASSGFTDAFVSYLNTRIEVLGSTGTLLEALGSPGN